MEQREASKLKLRSRSNAEHGHQVTPERNHATHSRVLEGSSTPADLPSWAADSEAWGAAAESTAMESLGVSSIG